MYPVVCALSYMCLQEECTAKVRWQAPSGVQGDTPRTADPGPAREGPPHINLATAEFDCFKHDYLAATGDLAHTSIASAVYGPGERLED